MKAKPKQPKFTVGKTPTFRSAEEQAKYFDRLAKKQKEEKGKKEKGQ